MTVLLSATIYTTNQTEISKTVDEPTSTTEVITTEVTTEFATEVATETTTKKITTTNKAPVTTEPKTDYTTFKVTAYCACSKCCGKSDGITASGTKATQGRTIAVDPKVIPLGSTVILNGQEYVAEDVGGAVKGNRIDLYFDSHQDALNFGVQYLQGVVV